MTVTDPASFGLSTTLRDNIAKLSERARAQAQAASRSDRLADRITRFAGSMTFVAVHLVAYGAWIAINLGWLPIMPRFDPSFVILAMEASVEAIFLSTFVLISQNRMADAAMRQSELDLHISLLAEHELTQVAMLLGRVARRLDVPVDGDTYGQVERDVEPVAVMDALDAERTAAPAVTNDDGGHDPVAHDEIAQR